jgi:hypothetical protein
MTPLSKVHIIPGYDCYDWRNGHTILQHAHTAEWSDVLSVLQNFRLKHTDISKKGGRKTAVAQAIDSELYSRGWKEKKFETKIVVDQAESESPTHKVDCFKGKVALEVEWNNKDPFFDRDLNNFRLLFDLRVVDVGIIVTRTTELQKWQQARYVQFNKSKDTFGPSTTHVEKILPRIVGGGAGGCPVVVFGMTDTLYLDDRV